MPKKANNMAKKLVKNKKDLDKDVEDFYSLLAEAQEGATQEDFEAPAEMVAEEQSIFEDEYEGQLSMDVYQTSGEFVIRSAIAGVDPEDIDVSVSNDMVTIRGKRQDEEAPKDAEYLFSECYWGNFSRTVILPAEINTKKISAKMDKGILEVRLTKIKKEKSVTIKVSEK